VVRNDTFAVLRAGTDAGWGVAVVCGSGLNCSGIGPDGRTVRFPALGAISGDWGGGTDLGIAALGAALRARDGRGPRTELEHVVPATFGLATAERVMGDVHAGRLAQEQLKDLVPGVFGAAERGDGPARALVARQAEETVAMASAAIRRLRLQELAFDVVLGGGVLQAGHAPLVDAIRSGVLEAAPQARVLVLEGPPLVGAALLALDELGGRRSALSRLRASLTNDRLTRYQVDEEEA
jgi:N-acetylglucosamine kinase-like BadF-type ATPase